MRLRRAQDGGPSPVGAGFKPARLWAALVLAALVALSGPARADGDAAAAQMRALVNAERARLGLPTVVSDPLLARVAEAHARDMADNDFFSHTGSDGLGFGDRFLRAGYDWQYAAENIGAGLATAAETFRAWMASAPHRRNILSPEAREMGLGRAIRLDDGGALRYRWYWTLELGRRAGRR